MDRQQSFLRLKQPCIQVLQATASLAQRPESRKELITALTNLLSTLQAIETKPGSFDPKLVEYAFVPISQVLRLSRQVPVHALETCLECISTLLRANWGGGLEPALSVQLLILFTFLAKPSSAENGIAATSEELQSLALKCMAELLTETCRSSQNRDAIVATPNIPTLGEAVLVMLDSLTDYKSSIARLHAASAIKAVILAIDDNDALASFLPKMVSSLTKVLNPSNSNRPGFRVVEQCLAVLALLISRLLSDKNTKNLPPLAPQDMPQNSSKVFRSASWLQATASQIKLALANVFRLRTHDKLEVRQALLRLCLQVVQNCRISLSSCTGMAIEAAISLVGRNDGPDTIEGELRILLSMDPRLSDLLRESLLGWIVSLPRVMQSTDDDARSQILHQVSVALRLCPGDQGSIDERLAASLRDGVSTVLKDSKGLEDLAVNQPKVSDQAMRLITRTSPEFQPLELRLKGQENIMAGFILLIQDLSKTRSALPVLHELSQMIDVGSQEARLANFWLTVNLIRDITKESSAFEDVIDMGTRNIRQELLDGLYTHSITILTQHEDNYIPWHFQALALETIALQSSQYKTDFRAELSDVLYPVLHHLGHSNPALQKHALTCLNMLSTNCGYTDAGELVITNVDYIVNAIGLKLAIGDISPQAPQVLLMMMRLCGPSLLPYLDDLVGSIFEALERYHGYHKLVELLFTVLKGLTEEGVKASQLALTQSCHEEAHSYHNKSPSMVVVVEAVKQLNDHSRKRRAQDAQHTETPFPHEPWKTATGTQTQMESDDRDDGQPSETTETMKLPPAPRIFNLLLRISDLTQHHLPTSSPSLRISLISLLKTTIPVLAKHQDSFLPLINTLWPVLLPRLQDPEAYVVSNVLDIVALMCKNAGDFMQSRIQVSWELFRRVYNRTENPSDRKISNRTVTAPSIGLTSIETGMESLSVDPIPLQNVDRPELYVDAPTRMIRSSFVALMCAIAGHVVIHEEHFDEILQILEPILDREDVHQALESHNADAVWLRIYKKTRRMSAGASALVGKAPVGKRHWQFLRI